MVVSSGSVRGMRGWSGVLLALLLTLDSILVGLLMAGRRELEGLALDDARRAGVVARIEGLTVLRGFFCGLLARVLAARGIPYVLLEGPVAQRVATARATLASS